MSATNTLVSKVSAFHRNVVTEAEKPKIEMGDTSFEYVIVELLLLVAYLL